LRLRSCGTHAINQPCMPHPRQVAQLHGFEIIFFRARAVPDPSGQNPQFANLDQSVSSLRCRAVLPLQKQEPADLGPRTFPSDDSIATIRIIPKGWHAGPCRTVVPRIKTASKTCQARARDSASAKRRRSFPLCTISSAALHPSHRTDDLVVGQGGVSPLMLPHDIVPVSSTISASIKPRSGDRGAASVDSLLCIPVFARPAHNLRRRFAILDGAQTDLAQTRIHRRPWPSRKVLLRPLPCFNNRGPCVHLWTPRGGKFRNQRCDGNRHRLRPTISLGGPAYCTRG